MVKRKENEPVMSHEEAAERMGARVEEILVVQPHSHGVVVITTDGTKTLLCDRPDGNGRTGLMLLARPDGREIDDPEAPVLVLPVFSPTGTEEVEEIDHIDELVDVDDETGVAHVVEPEPAPPEKKTK